MEQNVIVDSDPALSYERTEGWGRAVHFFRTLILRSLPSSIRPYLRKTHQGAQAIIDQATTHAALEVLYQRGGKGSDANLLQRMFRAIWFSTNNSKAVRNRLRLVKRELRNRLLDLFRENRPVSVLSIASGSARAVLETLEEIPHSPASVSVTFLDKNPEALRYSRRLAEEKILPYSFEWLEGSAKTALEGALAGKTYDIVEMVGLMDYFEDHRAVELFAAIKKRLAPRGILITANIALNDEEPFITRVVGWSMVYRTAEELASLLERAGFARNAMAVFYEPLKIHTVITAKNSY